MSGEHRNTRDVTHELGEAIRLYRSGQLAEAARLCEFVRNQAPDNVTALVLSGTIELQSGRYGPADQLFEHALAIAPHSADAAMGRATTLRVLGKHDRALAVLDEFLLQRPDYAVAWSNRGNLLLETGHISNAVDSYDRAISLEPNYIDALHNRGVAHMASGENLRAEADFSRVLELKAGHVQALVNRGTARARQGANRAQEAILDLQQAVSLDKGNADAWHILGQAYLALGQHVQALSSWSTGVSCQPKHGAMLQDRAFLFMSLARYAEAFADFERLVALYPGDAAAWQGRGIALVRLVRNEDAIASFTQALRLKPDDTLSLYNRAALFSASKKHQEAASDLERLISVNPEYPLACGLLLNARLHSCDWKNLDRQREDIDASLQRGLRVIHPFTYVLIADHPAHELACAQLQTNAAYPAAPKPVYRGEQYRHEKIRVAYLSSDFHQHATSYLMAGVLENHDRSRFEIFGISYGIDDKSGVRARVQNACTRFLDVRERDDISIATQLRSLEIDIAIDLKGHTGGARPGIVAHRPCPVQVNYLGYPGSMGADYIDYLIADRTVIPPAERRFYSEQIVYLPDTYQPNDSARAIAPEGMTRQDAGLPEPSFVFCCFNGSQKILPSTFDSWMRILSRSKNAVLWLLEDNPDATANLRREARSRGVAPERLIFARHEPLDCHLARLKLADLVLDTLPYGAHTTASDALWAGVPMLTHMGRTFAGRVAASLLRAVGLPELILQSAADYEAAAEKFAAAPELILNAKEKLARNRNSCTLFDTVRMTRNLETAYFQMWERHQRREPPRSFEI